jgi:hypothetical protein
VNLLPEWTFWHPKPIPRFRTPVEVDHDMAADFQTACHRAIEYMRDGKPGRARYELARSAERCARIAGEPNQLPIPPLMVVQP